MPPTAVTFDADQTLWDFSSVQQRALEATVAAMIERGDARADQVTAEQLQAKRSESVKAYKGRPHRLEDVREHSFAATLEEIGHPEPGTAAAELVQIYLQVRFDAIKLYPEVASSLARLKPSFKLGLLTNGNTYPDRCGLPDTFEATVLGPDHGFDKPDPRAFEMIASELGVALDSVMHVGDGWDDIEGANLVGATAVFMNRTGADPPFRATAAYEVRNLLELETLLEGLG